MQKKTHKEIDRIQKSGNVIKGCHEELHHFIKPGITTLDIDSYVESFIRKNKAYPSLKGFNNYPFATCCSVNQSVAHEPPSKRTLKEGDIVSVDIVANVEGYHADRCFTYSVGEVDSEMKHLINVADTALKIGVSQCKEGRKISEVGQEIEDYVLKHQFSIVYQLGGHGIGREIHEEPFFPHLGAIEEEWDFFLEEGMVLTIEPMLNIGLPEIVLKEDGWTYETIDRKNSAHFEHTILIKDDCAEVLT